MHRSEATDTAVMTRALNWLTGVCVALALLAILGLVRADDDLAAAEARAWQRGYQAGLEQRSRSVAAAYQQGQRDMARAQAVPVQSTAEGTR